MLTKSFWQRFIPHSKATSGQENACFWQVDIHSHLLPGLDDGVKTYEQSLECIRQLADWGIQKIITTPHISCDMYPNETDTIIERRDKLRQYVNQANISIKIEVAAEYMLDGFFPTLLAKGDLLSFSSERYLLVETGWASAPMQLEQLLFQIQVQGYIPVLAHPERYVYYHDKTEYLHRLHELGCLFQLNWASLTGRYGSRVNTQAQLMLKNNWVDFIGSDLHRPDDLQKLNELFKQPVYNLLGKQPLRNKQL